MQLGPFTLKMPVWRDAQVLAQPVPAQGTKTCPPCFGNCKQGHACPARQPVKAAPTH